MLLWWRERSGSGEKQPTLGHEQQPCWLQRVGRRLTSRATRWVENPPTRGRIAAKKSVRRHIVKVRRRISCWYETCKCSAYGLLCLLVLFASFLKHISKSAPAHSHRRARVGDTKDTILYNERYHTVHPCSLFSCASFIACDDGRSPNFFENKVWCRRSCRSKGPAIESSVVSSPKAVN